MKNPIFKRWWFWVLVVIIGVGALSNMGKDKETTTTAGIENKTNTTPTAAAEPKKEKYEILEQKFEDGEYGIRYVTGKIKNNSGKKASYAQVEINLYGNDGIQLGSTLANINNLEPDGIWSFKALVTQKDATSYKIMKVTGF